MFCFDATAKDAAEPGRSRIIRPERFRRFTALSPFRVLGGTHAAAAYLGLTSRSPQSPISALTVQPRS